jgi:hypothetical protein
MPTSLQKPAPSGCRAMSLDAGNRGSKYYRYEFLSVSLGSCFILLYYSYELCLQVCESLRPVVVELCYLMLEIGGANTTGTSFHRFPLVLVSFCSTIATNYAYEFAKACAWWLSSYVTLC